MINDLLEIGVSLKICKFILNLLSDRRIFFRINGENKGPYFLNKGLPQGCILSPILYLVYTRNLHKVLPLGCKIIEFADDIVLYVSADNPEDCIILLQQALDSLSSFLFNRGLSISATKSKLVIFPVPINKLSNKIFLTFGNQTIVPSEDATFLGITFHCTLSWDLHFNKLICRFQQVLNMLKCLSGTWWGSHPQTLRLFYQAYGRSSFEYGCHVLAIFNDKFFLKLLKLHNNFLRVILGYRLSTPILVMQAELREFPLLARFQMLSDKFLIRSFQVFHHPMFSILEELCYISSHGLTNYNLDKGFLLLISYHKFRGYIPRVLNSSIHPFYLSPFDSHFFLPNIDTQFGFVLQHSNCPNNIFQNYISHKFSNSIHFYTDGSKSPDSLVGFSFFSPQLFLERQFKISFHASIFTAEALAICENIQFILDEGIPSSVIFSDSKSILLACQTSKVSSITSYLILKIRNLLFEAANCNLSITLFWIPGYKGISGNERADALARFAPIQGSHLDILLPHSDIWVTAFTKFLEKVSYNWRQSSNVENKGVFYFKNFFFDLSSCKKPWFHGSKLNRMWISTISRIRSNHYNLAFSRARKNLSDSSECAYCGFESEDINHVIWACPRFSDSRLSLKRNLIDSHIFPPFNVESLISYSFKKGFRCLISFLKENNLFL